MIEKLAGAVDAGAEPPAEERQPHATQRMQRALNTLQACFLLGGPRRIMMRLATRNRCMPTPPAIEGDAQRGRRSNDGEASEFGARREVEHPLVRKKADGKEMRLPHI